MDPERLSSKLRQMGLGEGNDEEEASIYFRVVGRGEMDWYAIRSDSMTPENELLNPILIENKTPQNYSTAAALGSTIYSFGGADFHHGTLRDETFKAVYSIDTNYPERGWKQVASLQQQRGRAYAVAVNGRIFIFMGFSYAEMARPRSAEMFDPQTKICLQLKNIPWPIGRPSAHAVLDGEERILLYSEVEDTICSYFVSRDDYFPYCGSLTRKRTKRHMETMYKEDNKCRIETMAVVDGVVYIAGNKLKWGVLAALDVGCRKPKAHPVLGLENVTWLPGRSTEPVFPGFHLVAIGKSKLALMWSAPSKFFLKVYCAKMEVSKKTLDSGQIVFEARNATRFKYLVDAISLELCLPVFTTWKEEEKKHSDYQSKEEEQQIDKSSEKHSDNQSKKEEQEVNKKKRKKRLKTRKFKMLEKEALNMMVSAWKKEQKKKIEPEGLEWGESTVW